MRRLGLDLVDEHFYCSDEWFLSQGLRYDDYPRKGPKVFAGEYACHVKGKKWNHFYPAILEAAFMTGMERNADIVEMATYAPLLAHIEGWQWRPDMIWFDNLHSTVTSSYLVQQMFATNKGNRTVPVTIGGKPVAGTDGQNGLFASASCDETSGDYILKIVNTSGTPQPATVRLKGLKKASIISAGELTLSPPSAGISDDGTAIPDLDAENTIGSPLLITPVHHTVTPSSSTTIDVTIPPYSFSICRIRVAHRQ